MKFESIGGNSRETQYSLYDYSDNPFGETIMSIVVHRDSGDWWFVGKPKDEMNKEHAVALCSFLADLMNESL